MNAGLMMSEFLHGTACTWLLPLPLPLPPTPRPPILLVSFPDVVQVRLGGIQKGEPLEIAAAVCYSTDWILF